MADDKLCFVIPPIGEQDSEIRKRSNKILTHVIRPPLTECGYKAERADEIAEPGIITNQVIQRVINYPLVIADLTDDNPNVFYELAIRHTIRKPLVQIIQRGKRIPFDIAHSRVILVDDHDLDDVDRAKQDIVKQIKQLEANPSDIETPISASLDLQALSHSENPEDRSLADILSGIAATKSIIDRIEGKVATLPAELVSAMVRDVMSDFFFKLDETLRKISTESRQTVEHDPFLVFTIADIMQGHMENKLVLLVVLSLYKQDLPWLYDIGMEIFRASLRGDAATERTLVNLLLQTVIFLMQEPQMADLMLFAKRAYYRLNELKDVVTRYATSISA